MAIDNVLAGVAVRDLAAAKRWYATLLGRAADQEPMDEVAEWRFARGGWLQVFSGDDARAGKSSVTLAVDDLDAELARLDAAGVETGEPTRTDSVDTAILRDPDGNQIVLAQAKAGSGMAR